VITQPTENPPGPTAQTQQRAEELIRTMLTQCITPASIVEALAAAGLLRTEPAPTTETASWMQDALRAVHEALAIPPAATTGGRIRQELLESRAMYAVITLETLLENPGVDGLRAHISIDWLRERLADRPATCYVTSEQAQAALAAGKSWTEATTLPGGES
jgi:hypothetical protein